MSSICSSTMKMCEQNVANRDKLVTPHTGGSKSFARKQDEMETECGVNHVTRGALYDATHKRKDVSYITEEARVSSVSSSIFLACVVVVCVLLVLNKFGLFRFHGILFLVKLFSCVVFCVEDCADSVCFSI